MKSQVIDSDMTHEQVSRQSTVRVLISLAVEFKLIFDLIDASTAFLNAVIHHEEYVKPHTEFEYLVPHGKPQNLLKCLYGLKQASRIWNRLLDDFLKKESGMKPCSADHCLYTRYEGDFLELGILIYCRRHINNGT